MSFGRLTRFVTSTAGQQSMNFGAGGSAPSAGGVTGRKMHHVKAQKAAHQKKGPYVRHPRGDAKTDARQAYLAKHRKRAYRHRRG